MDPNDVSSKLIELEDRSRQNNLHIDGIKETTSKTCEDCKLKYKNYSRTGLKWMKLKFTEIDLFHRLSRKKNQNRPCAIICRITRCKEKQEILKNAKLLLAFSSMKIFFFSFFYLGFLSQPFTNHRTTGEVGGHFFNSRARQI